MQGYKDTIKGVKKNIIHPPSKLMECNRDEAIRAKTIAEKKFADEDYIGGKKFTLKAQTLNPLLDGISHMLITLDVYISSENKVNGESDWYKVLDVKPSDDDETIKKQYRKLVLILHPDKNKSVGADGAFKIVSEAWSLLSDKTKRLAYNQRRNSFQSECSLPASGVNGVYSCVNRTMTRPKSQNFGSKLDSFWTICHGCKMHYEYLKVYVNYTVICLNCHKPFHAVEIPTPINIPKPGYPQPKSQNCGSKLDSFWTMCHGCKMSYKYLKVYENHTLICLNCHNPFHAVEIPTPINIPKPGYPQWNQNSGNGGMYNSGWAASGIHWGPSSRANVPDDRLRKGGVFYGQPPLKRRKEEDGGPSCNVKIPYQTATGGRRFL